MGGGKTTSKTTVKIPPKTEEEKALLQKQNALLDLQVQEIRRQNEALASVFPQQKELLQAQTQAALFQADLFKRQIPLLEGMLTETDTQKQIRELSEQNALRQLRGEAPLLSEVQNRELEQLYGAATAEGQRAVRQFGEEMAAARGLRLTDTPAAAEVLRESSRLQEQLQGAKAGAKLNVGQAQQVFTEGVRQFQEGLKQQAFQNRLALAGRPPGPGQPILGTGAAGQAFSQITPLVDVLGQQRLAGRSTSTTQAYQPGFFDYFTVLTNAAAAAAGGMAASSATLKRDIVPLDRDEYEIAMQKLRETPITRWRYRWESPDRTPHIGPILELAPEEIRADALRLSLLDYAGLQHAGLKAVDRRVQRLEQRALPLPERE